MTFNVTIAGLSKDEEVIFDIKTNWIDGVYLISDKRFHSYEVNPGYLDMSASLSISEMKEFHKEHDSEFARDEYKKEMKFLDDALNVYGDKVYSRFVVNIAEW
jgi:hypothetical protein